MKLVRLAFASAAPAALLLAATATPAAAQAGASSAPSAFEYAMLAVLDDATRAEVASRATEGNSIIGVVSTILLNHYQEAGPRNPGQSLEVVAVDFARGVVIIQRAPNAFEIRRFDPRTLQLR